jgi:predicted deacylase
MKASLLLTCLLLILLLYLLFLQSIPSYCNKLDVHVFNGTEPGPTVLFIGSVHGNEPAGSYALTRLLEMNYFQRVRKGKVIVVPNPNPCGKILNTRYQPHTFADLNRTYKSSTLKTNTTSRRISKLIQQADIVVDLHEGWGFHQISPDSMGSALYPSSELHDVSSKILADINKTIDDPLKHFLILPVPPLEGTIDEYAGSLGKNTLVVETTGQNNIQPIKIRARQHTIVVTRLLQYYEMI